MTKKQISNWRVPTVLIGFSAVFIGAPFLAAYINSQVFNPPKKEYQEVSCQSTETFSQPNYGISYEFTMDEYIVDIYESYSINADVKCTLEGNNSLGGINSELRARMVSLYDPSNKESPNYLTGYDYGGDFNWDQIEFMKNNLRSRVYFKDGKMLWFGGNSLSKGETFPRGYEVLKLTNLLDQARSMISETNMTRVGEVRYIEQPGSN